MRKIFSGILVALTVFSACTLLPVGASAKGEEEIITEVISSDWLYDFPENAADVSIELDGKRVLVGEAAIIDDVTYVPLRSFSELLGADSIEWDARRSIATVKKDSTVVSVGESAYYIEAAGRYFYFDAPIRNISDRLFLPIRPIAKALGVEVGWDNYRRTVTLRDTGESLVPAERYYSADDLYWLARIINAESGGEPFIGKIAVGNVVLNRRASSAYPNSIYGVIFDRKGGTQFTPAVTGTIYRKPSEDSIKAAKVCLEGYSVDGRILFFMNPAIATNNWISKNRPFAFRIANHTFYY